MVYQPVTEEQTADFFRQRYGAHLPGYTGHCPTLKFRVGKRFGANTEEIMKELLERKILKTGPYRPPSGADALIEIPREKDIRRDWKTDACIYKSAPYILGYTGYIPGFNSIYGLTFMKAVEEGALEWRETQNKLRARRDSLKARTERSKAQLSRQDDDVILDAYVTKRPVFDHQVTPERPPIVGYTGHIPGAKGEVALSRRYAQAAKRGLQLLQKEREGRISRMKDMSGVQRVLDDAHLDNTGHTRT